MLFSTPRKFLAVERKFFDIVLKGKVYDILRIIENDFRSCFFVCFFDEETKCFFKAVFSLGEGLQLLEEFERKRQSFDFLSRKEQAWKISQAGGMEQGWQVASTLLKTHTSMVFLGDGS